MVLPFCFPAALILPIAGLDEAKKPQRGKCPPPDSDCETSRIIGAVALRISWQMLRNYWFLSPELVVCSRDSHPLFRERFI
jgi:hypothetical protein